MAADVPYFLLPLRAHTGAATRPFRTTKASQGMKTLVPAITLFELP
jgi:hypothetical protein